MTAAWEQRQRRTDAYRAEIERQRGMAHSLRTSANFADAEADRISLLLAKENVDTMADLGMETPC